MLQRTHRQNATWLTWFAPFRALSISAAYLTPFFLQHGLSLAQVFGLQSIFSAAFLLWELPSGLIADRFGRAFSIKLSAPIAAAAMIAYGFSSHFWQFVVWELVLAFANGLISGVDTALLIDSLRADKRESDFVAVSQRINAVAFAATAVGVPIAVVLVHYVNLGSTLVADGLLSAVGAWFAWQLREAPHYNGSQEAVRLSAWAAVGELSHNVEARWFIILGSTLSTATYLSFWLSAPYYQHIGIPVVLFGAILAVRSLWKAWLSHRAVVVNRHLGRALLSYTILAGLVYLAMASGQLWLVWMVFGHDMVQALQTQPIAARLNGHIGNEYRATLNSLINLIQRLFYTVGGPLVGILTDHYGLSVGFLATGGATSFLAFVALWRLKRLGAFAEKR